MVIVLPAMVTVAVAGGLGGCAALKVTAAMLNAVQINKDLIISFFSSNEF
jgi:hypothetical protein